MFRREIFTILSIIFAFSINDTTTINLYLYNSQIENGVQIENMDPSEVPLNPSQPTKIICHGILSNSSASWYEPLIRAYLNLEYNIIAVNWEEDAFDGYINAIDAAREIGKSIANYILSLHLVKSFPLSDIHFIGHSLGAHIGGHVGKNIYALTNEKIGRITGLDPAGPLFIAVLAHQRLSSGDAEFVDVIHTNAGEFGILISIGDIDFYPNGGTVQNSCKLLGGCSHNIAPEYMIESITSNNFVARKCSTHISYILGLCNNNDQAIMGEGTLPGASGDFYLTTNSNPPYGKG